MKARRTFTSVSPEGQAPSCPSDNPAPCKITPPSSTEGKTELAPPQSTVSAFLLGVALLFTVITTSSNAQEVSALDTQPLVRFLAAQASIHTLTADFLQERELPTLNKPLKVHGRMWIKHPDHFRWQIGNPVQSILLRTPESLRFIDVENHKSKNLNPRSKRASQFMLMLSQIPDTLEAFEQKFEIRSTVRQKDIYKVTLAPQQHQMRAHVPWMILHIDTTTHQLSGFEIFTKDKSVIRTFFDNVKINPDIDNDQFEFTLSD